MKTGYRPKSYRLWRAGDRGLARIQRIVDRAIEEAEAEALKSAGDKSEAAFADLRAVCLSGLPDLKLRLNRELRENAAHELRHRRETIEIEDIELARKADIGYLNSVRERIEAQVRQLLELDDLKSVLRRDPSAIDSTAADDGSRPPGPGPTAADNASTANGNSQQATISGTVNERSHSEGSSEGGPDGPPPSPEADAPEARTDEPGDTEMRQ